VDHDQGTVTSGERPAHFKKENNMTTTTLEYEHELKVFVDGMRLKMHKNRHKGRWENLDLQQTLQLLRGEIDELEEAINNNNEVEILLESCDVGVYALIVANIAMKQAVGAK
jgi:NTP pyrophosphatase (non-canonical NTP hydrolase)